MSEESPITVKLAREEGEEGFDFATLANGLHAGNKIGYRFFEHTPLVHGSIPKDNMEAGIDSAKVTDLEEDFSNRAGVVIYKYRVEHEHWQPQHWTFYMVAVADGVDLLLAVETYDKGLNSYYGIQQCFRMSGKTNADWRRVIADSPDFSEFDLWQSQEREKIAQTSLTYVLRKGKWETLPAKKSSVGARTPLGLRIDTERTNGKLENMPRVGPYQAEMFEPVDCGLVTRTNREKTRICGIFWEGTSHVTDHHPADCLHNIVNIGGLPPNSKRAVRGKIYWFAGTLDDLLLKWNNDFAAVH